VIKLADEKKDERIIVIPLGCDAKVAVKKIKDYVGRSVKKSEVKLADSLNKRIWACGGKAPRKIKVKVFIEEESATVSPAE